MRKALALAERGRGTTSPNPMVGAVVVDADGVVVGRGSHRSAGGPHAEVLALREAGERARGATLYCTLEPCCHVGRTGPCAPLVADAGIRRAVVAIEDPNPLVNGEGLRYLRTHGVDVTVGVLRDQAALRTSASSPTCGTAAVRDPEGRAQPRRVRRGSAGNPDAAHGSRRRPVHAPTAGRSRRDRRRLGTVLADDPLLTPRGAYRARPLTRVIFDRRLRTPPDARVLSTRAAGLS